jgi:hypothetical protein
VGFDFFSRKKKKAARNAPQPPAVDCYVVVYNSIPTPFPINDLLKPETAKELAKAAYSTFSSQLRYAIFNREEMAIQFSVPKYHRINGSKQGAYILSIVGYDDAEAKDMIAEGKLLEIFTIARDCTQLNPQENTSPETPIFSLTNPHYRPLDQNKPK